MNDCLCVLWHFLLPWLAHYELGFIFGLCRCLISLHFSWSFVLSLSHSIFLLVHLSPVILLFLIFKSHFPNQCLSCLGHELWYSQETSGIFSFVLCESGKTLVFYQNTVTEWERLAVYETLYLFCSFKDYPFWCFCEVLFFSNLKISRLPWQASG